MNRREALAVTVMLAAVFASLFALAKPSGPAAAAPGTPTDIGVTLAASCNPDNSAKQIQVSLSSFGSAPVGVRVELQLIPTAAPSFSSTLSTGNVPTYMSMTNTGATAWLSGVVDAATPQSVLIQADNFDPTIVPLVNLACDPLLAPPIDSSDLGLTALAGSPIGITSFSCDVVNGSNNGNASLAVAMTDPNLSLPTNYVTASGGMTEIDYGVFVTNGLAQIVSSNASGVAQFDSSTLPPTVAVTTASSSTFDIPLAGQTDYQLWVIGTDGVAFEQPMPALLDAANGSPLDCTPPTPTPTPTPTTPSTTSSPPNTRTPSDTPTAIDTPSPTDNPSDSPSALPPVQSTTALPSVSQPAEPSSPAFSDPISPSIGPSRPSSLPTGSPVLSASGASTFSNLVSPSSRPTLSTVKSSGAPAFTGDGDPSFSQPGSDSRADGGSTAKGLEILNWHGDAAIVVGFDAVAVFSLVGATVWSSRRR